MEQLKLFPGDCMPEDVSLLDLVSRYVKTYGVESIELQPLIELPAWAEKSSRAVDLMPPKSDFKLPRNLNQD
jgi:hypothetical protein